MHRTPLVYQHLLHANESGASVFALKGKDLAQLESLAGQTPFFLYSRAIIQQTIDRLRAALPEQISIYYAIKANPFVPLVDAMARWVDGFDIASQGELLLALNSGMAARDIAFSGPGKSQRELRAAIASGVCIHIESLHQARQIIALAKQSGVQQVPVAIRINPDFELKSAGMKMGGSASPFGVDVAQLEQILSLCCEPPLCLRGFHIYNGSQHLDAQAISANFQAIFALIDQILRRYQLSIDYLNLGGGLGVPYFERQQPLDIDLIGVNLRQYLKDFDFTQKQTRIILELGRYLVAEAGIYVCKVVDKKVSQGQQFAIVDGGLHHHLANSGNFGQVLRKNYPYLVLSADSGIRGRMTEDRGQRTEDRRQKTEDRGQMTEDCPIVDSVQKSEALSCHLCGHLCTPLDIVAQNLSINPEIGDYVLILQSGAYAYTASPQQFLSHPVAREIII